MKYTTLSRKEYSTRIFLVDNIPEYKLYAHIESELKKSFPGNHGQYLFFYRTKILSNQKIAFTVIVQKSLIEEKKDYFCPFFIVPEIISRIEPDWTGKLLIYSDNNIEEVDIKEGYPELSRISRQNNYNCDILLYYFSLCNNHEFLEKKLGNPRILNYRIPKKITLLKLPNKKVSNKIGFSIISLILFSLLILNLFLYKYKELQQHDIQNLKRNLNQRQKIEIEITEVEDRIVALKELNLKKQDTQQIDPYNLLSLIYDYTENDLTVLSLSINNNTFSIMGNSTNPMNITEKLTNSECFINININKIIPVENTFTFTLSGEYSE